MVQVNNSSVTAFRRVRSQELRTPGSAKHEKTRAELAASVHKSAAAAPLPDERARHRPRTAASRPGERGRGGIPAGAGPSPLPPPLRNGGTAPRARDREPAPPCWTGREAAAISHRIPLRARGWRSGRPVPPRRGCALTGSHPWAPQTKRGLTPFSSGQDGARGLGHRVHPRSPSRRSFCPGRARLTGEEKVPVPRLGTACPSTSRAAAGRTAGGRDHREGSRGELLGLPGTERVIPGDGAQPNKISERSLWIVLVHKSRALKALKFQRLKKEKRPVDTRQDFKSSSV